MRKISQPAVTSTEMLPGASTNGNAPAGDGELFGVSLLVEAGPQADNAGEAFRDLWALTGPFEQWWMPEYNAEVWGNETWRNDASGHSYESGVDPKP